MKRLLRWLLLGTVLVYINPDIVELEEYRNLIPNGIGFSLEGNAIRITGDRGKTLLYINLGEDTQVIYSWGKDGEP